MPEMSWALIWKTLMRRRIPGRSESSGANQVSLMYRWSNKSASHMPHCSANVH